MARRRGNSRRTDYLEDLCAEVGSAHVVILGANDGWPGMIEVQTGSGPRQLTVYIGLVNRMYKSRRPDDYRVLPPIGRPVQDVPDSTTVALGWWEGEPHVVVACDPGRWRDVSRSSQMIKLPRIREAQERGWATYHNTDGDIFQIFRPFLFPAYAEAVVRGVELSETLVRSFIEPAWSNDDDTRGTQERARRACTALVRDRAFGRDVVTAYGGRCAVCGLNFGLVQGAHIYPVAAPSSPDEVWNGLCLCPNHHQAFDAHLIWIDPDTGAIRLHPRFTTDAQTPGDKTLAGTSLPAIRQPSTAVSRPRPEMFRKRYEQYPERYGWV